MATDSASTALAGSIREGDVPPVHRGTLRRMLALFRELPADRVRLELVHEKPHWSKLIATPSNDAAARIEVWFYGDNDARNVGPVAGVHAGLNLSSDLFGEAYQDTRELAEENWREFLENLVRGIIEGTLVETLVYRGNRLVKSTFAVRVGKEPFTFTRTNVPNWIKSLFKKPEEKTISYVSY